MPPSPSTDNRHSIAPLVSSCCYVVAGLFLVGQPFIYDYGDSVAGKGDVVFYTAFFVLALLGLLCGLAFACSFCNKGKRLELRLSTVDAAVSLYLLYGALNAVLVRDYAPDALWWIRWVALVGSYALVRLSPDKKWLIYALVVSGVVQAAIAIGQHRWLIESNHLLFGITGSLGNPGQLGGYLAVCFTASFRVAIEGIRRSRSLVMKRRSRSLVMKRRARRGTIIRIVLSGAACAVMLAGLILSDSRAGTLGALCGVVMCLAGGIKFGSTGRRIIVSGVALAATALVLAAMFFYRPASASARLLTWRVSGDMIAAKPVFGHGAGAFNDDYMLYQARYFEAHPDSRFVSVADNVVYTYNELLHVGTEQGVVGIMLAAAIFILIFAARRQSPTGRAVKCVLAALLVFSMFSYPADIFPLMFLFAVLAGAAQSGTVKKIVPPRWLLVVCTVALGLMFVWSATTFGRYRELSAALDSLHHAKEKTTARAQSPHNPQNNSEQTNAILCRAYPSFRGNIHMRNLYLNWVAENATTQAEILPATAIMPACESYCMLGDAFARLGLAAEALHYYELAAHMIPTRLTPNFNLWKLHVENGDTVRATAAARRILTQPLKAENTVNIRQKAQVREWLEENTNHGNLRETSKSE